MPDNDNETDRPDSGGVPPLDLSKWHKAFEVVISPEQAALIVAATQEANANFRVATPQSTHLRKLTDAMSEGLWRWPDPPPIRLSEDLSLCSDGIHRLTACVRSGVPLRCLVLVGSEWAAGINTDRNQNRTVAQYLKHHGITGGGTAIAAVSRSHMVRVESVRRQISAGHARIYVHEEAVVDFVHTHLAALRWVVARQKSAEARGLNGNGYGVVLLELMMADPVLANQLHEWLLDPDLEVLAPLSQLRQFTTRHFSRTGKRFAQGWTTNNVIKAWNTTCAGEPLKMWKPALWDDVRWADGGRPEDWSAAAERVKAFVESFEEDSES